MGAVPIFTNRHSEAYLYEILMRFVNVLSALKNSYYLLEGLKESVELYTSFTPSNFVSLSRCGYLALTTQVCAHSHSV